MNIFKKKSLEGGFTMIGNGIFRSGLSAKAIGILCTMFSLPDDWDLSVSGLTKILGDGKDSIGSGLKELQQAGYLKIEKIRKDGKIVGTQWTISDSPNLEKPETGKPYTENPQQLNKQKQNKQKQNTQTSYDFPKVSKEKRAEKQNGKDSTKQKQAVQELISSFSHDEATIQRLGEWMEIRESKKIPPTTASIRKNLEQLPAMASQSGLDINSYLDQIIMRGWAAFFALPQSRLPKVESESVKAGTYDRMAHRTRPLCFVAQA